MSRLTLASTPTQIVELLVLLHGCERGLHAGVPAGHVDELCSRW